MIILDENFPESQRLLLRNWKISIRQIGSDVGKKGVSDENIIPLLLRLHNPTFFTLDEDFFDKALCHANYCLICLDVRQYESAFFTRRILQHNELDAERKRMGNVIRVTHKNISMWKIHQEKLIEIDW